MSLWLQIYPNQAKSKKLADFKAVLAEDSGVVAQCADLKSRWRILLNAWPSVHCCILRESLFLRVNDFAAKFPMPGHEDHWYHLRWSSQLLMHAFEMCMTINFGVICYGNLCTLQTKDCKESPSADMETQPKKDDHLTLDILTEFIEVLIHQVLHMRCNLSLYNCCIFRWSLQTNFGSRDLYPASIFRKHRKFNMPLQMSIQVTSCLLN